MFKCTKCDYQSAEAGACPTCNESLVEGQAAVAAETPAQGAPVEEQSNTETPSESV
ncbi:MAG: hypothetical protein Q8M83_02705 [bacterium]|nr:hypothetical protein [bacterium]